MRKHMKRNSMQHSSNAPASASVMPIAVLDNDAIALDGLCRIIERNRLGTVAWRAQNGRDAVRLCLNPDTMPRLLLMDMSLDGMSGVDVCRQIRRRTPAVLMLGVTAFPLDRYSPRLKEAGAQGIVTKSEESQIVDAARTVLGGGVYPKGFDSSRNAYMRLKHDKNQTFTPLSDREEEVMVLLSQGSSVADVANSMHVSHATAATYLNRARHKLGAQTIRQAIAMWTGEYEQ